MKMRKYLFGTWPVVLGYYPLLAIIQRALTYHYQFCCKAKISSCRKEGEETNNWLISRLGPHARYRYFVQLSMVIQKCAKGDLIQLFDKTIVYSLFKSNHRAWQTDSPVDKYYFTWTKKGVRCYTKSIDGLYRGHLYIIICRGLRFLQDYYISVHWWPLSVMSFSLFAFDKIA